MKIETVLTVAQSKRLIARGVKEHHAVKPALIKGTIVICRGTTCTYVAEEFLGHRLEKFSYTTGLTLPSDPHPPVETPKTKMHDVIIRNGEIHTDSTTVIDAAKDMKPGDVIIKGANALNYDRRIAASLVGHPAGGTVGGFWGPLYGRKIRLIIPVGLEKEIPGDITTLSSMTMDEYSGNALMPMTGSIITEIEAIELLTGAQAFPIAAGGIRGAEGSVRLMISGAPEQVNTLKRILAEIEQEPAF